MKKIYLYSTETYESIFKKYPNLTREQLQIISNLSDFKHEIETAYHFYDFTDIFKEKWYIEVPPKVAEYFEVDERLYIIPYSDGLLYQEIKTT